MTSHNRVILTGKVVTPPRRFYQPNGAPVLQFPLEIDDSGNHQDHQDPSGRALNRDGFRKAYRPHITVVALGKLAEFKFDLLQSGQHLMVIGKLHQRRWQTPEGKNRIQTEVIATQLRTIEMDQVSPKLKKQGE